MKSSTGRWVSGDNFFDRENELRILESRVRDGNHVLLTGQRRMGKTSLAQELGRRLKMEGWSFLYVDVEGATCPEDVIADIGEAVHPIRSIASRFAVTMGRWVGENVEEISASEFRVKIRAGLSGSWQRWGRELIGSCAEHDRPVLLVVDELPIFLMRMLLDEEEGVQRVDEFLSWFRSLSQGFQGKSPVFMVSGSIGLVPLVQRLGMPDRINHLHPCRLGPWSRHDTVECFKAWRRATIYRSTKGWLMRCMRRLVSVYLTMCSPTSPICRISS
ncbi:MAG: ATP-binding protein [Roseovarius sp.]|nr:ATP-binding protein [Roseovarius sp.]